MLQCVPDANQPDVVFVGSLAAIADAYQDEKAGELLALATSLATTLPYLIEGAIFGLLAERGYRPNQFVAIDAEAALRGRLTKWDDPSDA